MAMAMNMRVRLCQVPCHRVRTIHRNVPTTSTQSSSLALHLLMPDTKIKEVGYINCFPRLFIRNGQIKALIFIENGDLILVRKIHAVSIISVLIR